MKNILLTLLSALLFALCYLLYSESMAHEVDVQYLEFKLNQCEAEKIDSL